jgi:multidrug efflux pump subunit AcrB
MVTANGKPSVLLNVSRQPDSNTLQVANEAHALVQQLEPTLPKGVRIQPFYDQSLIVHDSIASVRDAVLIGIVLSSIVLVLFLRDWGTSLVAGLVIPVTLLITFIVLKIAGQSFNLMTLGGLAAAVGLVIDDAIVVLENIVLHRDLGQDRFVAIRSALRELTVPLLGSTVTPIVVFLPLIAMTGVNGAFFRALAITMTVALLTSLLLALTWTPTLSLYLVRRNQTASVKSETGAGSSGDSASLLAEDAHVSGFFGKIVSAYEKVMRSVVRRPVILGASVVVIVGLSVACYHFLGSDLLPTMDEGGFILDYHTPPGSSLSESNRILLRIEDMLKATPEVESTSRRTGLELGLAAVTEANRGDFTVKLKSKHSRSVDEITSDLRAQIESSEPATKVEFVQILQDMIGDLSNQPEPVVIRLYSQDGKLLNDIGPRVADAISKVPGVVDILNGVEDAVSGPAVTFQINPFAASRAGFTPEEVSVDASAILEGEPAATPVILSDRAYPIRVRFPEGNRASLERMTNTLLVSGTGKTATLGSLASISNDPGETEIRRENLQRLIQVTARLEGVDLGTGIAGVQKAVNDLHLPSSIRV